MREKKQNLNQTTIKDVAQAAGVSIATVSRVLNNKGGVSSALSEKVYAAAKSLRYQLNDVARALKVRESRSIGLMIPDIENPFFPALVRGVEDEAKVYDYGVILCNTDGDPAEEERYIKFLFSKRVDGILFTGGVDCEKNVELLLSLAVPVVLLDRKLSKTKVSSVTTDNHLGAFLATEHLIQCGRKKIAFVGGPRELSSALERKEGYLAALQHYNREQNNSLFVTGQFNFETGYGAVDQWLNQGENFDAIVTANDMMAIGAIERLYQADIQVPDQVAVVGYDDIRVAHWYKPSLTTIRQPIYEMGQWAVKMLVGQIMGEEHQCRQKILEPQLVIRQSSGDKGGD